MILTTKPNPVRFCSGRKCLQAANQMEDLAFKFSDRRIVIQLKHLCIILYLLWILICSF